ncbi:MAG: ATP-dependent Clp protease ATP-binding subunit [Candidatus Doudnabacteria bacterium]
MAEEKIKFLYCQNCAGKGCSQCENIGVVLKTPTRVFYWRPTRLDHYILNKKFSLIFNKVVDLAAISLGIIFLAHQFLSLYQNAATVGPWCGGLLLCWGRGGIGFSFWIAILIFSFVFFRLQRTSERQRKLTPAVLGFREVGGESITHFLRSPFLLDAEPFLDESSRMALARAWSLGRKNLDPFFIFKILLEKDRVQKIILRLGISPAVLEKKWQKIVPRFRALGDSSFPVKFKLMILDAVMMSLAEGRETISLPEIFWGAVKREPSLLAFFEDQNLNLQSLLNTINWVCEEEKLRRLSRKFFRKARFKPGGIMNRAYTSRATPLLDRFGDDLTLRAKYGAFPFLISREKEMEEILANLRQAEGDVIIVGRPGVGKSAIIYDFANLMVAENVPAVLRDKRLASLDLGALSASENPLALLKRIVEEVIKAGNIVLLIDNIAELIGLGRVGDNMDAAAILKPALSHPTVNVIGTAEEGDYKDILEPRTDLLRHFQVIKLEEPAGKQALEILEAQTILIEYKERVFFTYPALEKALELAKKYLPDSALPFSALNLLTDAASIIRKGGKVRLVSGKDIIKLVEREVHVPLAPATQAEGKKLLNLEEEIHKRIVDQEEGVKMIASALRRGRAGMRSEKRPMVSLLFVGPTGVGKTETAKALADVYFGSEKAMVRIDMSEYQTGDALNKLIGPPPGFAGAERGGYLTESVRRNPFSLILLDELEKAHPDIFNAFLQVIEDGRLTDGKGRTVDFTNAIIIATSNAGTPEITEAVKAGVELNTIKQKIIEEVLTQYYRLEFLNRFDGIVLFRPLAPEHVLLIAKLMLQAVGERLAKQNIRFECTEKAARELAQKGFDPVFGARPLRRLIQDTVDNALAKKILAGELKSRDLAILGEGGNISIQQAERI